MSFKIKAENIPSNAVYWIPVFYIGITCHFPDYLPIGESWVCPVSAGSGIICDFRCIIYDGAYKILDKKDIDDIAVKDNAEYSYNWISNMISEVGAIPAAWSIIGSDTVRGMFVSEEPAPPPSSKWQVIGEDKVISAEYTILNEFDALEVKY